MESRPDCRIGTGKDNARERLGILEEIKQRSTLVHVDEGRSKEPIVAGGKVGGAK
jgi:hypothetical protein